MKDVPTISINLEKNCSRCGAEGALPSGLCLKCGVKRVLREREGSRKPMPTEYSPASDVRRAGRQIIDKHHPHLHGVRIEFVFVEKRDKDGAPQPWEVNGRAKFGDTKKVSGLNAFLAMEEGADEAEDFFVVLVSAYAWGYMREETRAAYLDHYITRCALHEEKGTPILREPEIYEFGEVLKRHGLYHSELQGFIEIGAKQLKLEFPEGNGKEKKATKSTKARSAGTGAATTR